MWYLNSFIFCTTQRIYLKTLGTIGQWKNIRKLKFKDCETKQTAIANLSVFIHIYKLENDFFVKLTKLNYPTLYPKSFEKQKLSLAKNVFSENCSSFSENCSSFSVKG